MGDTIAEMKNTKTKKVVLFTAVIAVIMMANIASADQLTITAPGPITQETTGISTYIANLGTPTITGGVPPYTTNNSAPAGNNFPVGITTVTWATIDGTSNVAVDTQLVTITPIKLSITSYGPISPVEDTVPSNIKFNITTNMPANVTWSLDGVDKQDDISVTEDSYMGNISKIGSYTVVATARNGSDSISQTWTLDIKGTFEISAYPSSVNIGRPTNVTLEVSRMCGIEPGDNSSCTGTIPVVGANIDITGISGSGVTNDTGLFIITINATTNQTINATASKSGYISNSTEIISKVAPVSTPPSSGGGSNSGGSNSGGGDVSSPESFSNIIKFERQSRDLVANTPIMYSFSSAELAIYQVLVVSNVSDIDTDMRVEHLKNKSDTIDEDPIGTVYANENVWMESKRIDYATVRFKVENSWLINNNVSKDNIVLLRYSDGWKKLQTNITNSDDNYTYFESMSPDLSSFAITGITEYQTGQIEQIPIPIETVHNSASIQNQDVATTSHKENIPGFETISGISIISMVYIVMSIRNRRRVKR